MAELVIGKRLTKVSQTQMLTGGLDYFVVTTPESVVAEALTSTSSAAEVKTAQARDRVWEQMVEILRTRANVVIVGALSATGFSVAVEHVDAIDGDILTALQTLMQGIDGTDAGADLSGVTLTKVEFDLVV